MAFDDLTREQRRAMIELVAELSTGRYKSDFSPWHRIGGELHFLLYTHDGQHTREVRGLPGGDITALEHAGYIAVGRGGTSASISLKRKAQDEYDRYLQERNGDAYYERIWLDIFRAAGGRTDRSVALIDVLRDEDIDEEEAWRLADHYAGKGWFKLGADNGPPFGHLTQPGLEAANRVSQAKRPVAQLPSRMPAVQGATRQMLQEWAGASDGQSTLLSLVFTDVVGSTDMANLVGDKNWIGIIAAHFRRAHELAESHRGFVIKLIGDACMVAFKSTADAFGFIVDLYVEPGHPDLRIRAAIHTGQVYVMGDDIFGTMINFTSRVQHEVEQYGIAASTAAADDIRSSFGLDSDSVQLVPRETEIKSFGRKTIWRVHTPLTMESDVRRAARRKT